MQINTSNWDNRNMSINAAGELITRPGGDLIWRDILPLGSVARGGFSAKSQFLDIVQHYILIGVPPSPPDLVGNLELWVIDENLPDQTNEVRQRLVLGSDRPVGPITHAIVNGEIIISGPDFSTLWGYTGSGLILADKQDSIHVSLETLSVPNGLCVSWAGRCAVAVGEQVLVSDSLAPRTYTAPGIIYGFAGFIYGLFVSPNGSLVAVTANGVYSLSAQASVQGVGVSGSVEKISSYQATGYNKAAMTPYGLYGLTKRGYIRIDTNNADEVTISDKSYVRSLTDMISFPDYREGKMWATSTGLAITIGSMDEDDDDQYSGGMCIIDLYEKFRSWWTVKGVGRLRGILNEREGDDLFLFSDFNTPIQRTALYKFHRDFDHDQYDDPFFGSICGKIDVPSEMSPVVRAIFVAADNGGNPIKVAVRGEFRKKDGSPQSAITSSGDGVVVGSLATPEDDWLDSATPSNKRVKTAELESKRFQFAKRTNDISVEFAASGGKIRVGSIDLRKAGYGQRRPT
ncbi:MAG: hypothetical protein Unbinned4336contig1001_2 [Prokaryotic dsDNA virus sp.]|nr:MAG: hypothetical protein Unbinned4336contig1001_2 [Prokaryotic dsDNA virus sp.]|tara:strand:- start:1832 stop:3379 length:1548 start_codon:yes stop_codon:yes gene_type:complete